MVQVKMLEEDPKLDEEIEKFTRQAEILDSELVIFLTKWSAHPDYYTDLTRQVISNLSSLNVQLLNKLDTKKRFHLVKALCITVQLAFSMKQWEYTLGRKDGAWYWEGHGLFFSSLHALIPPLNELQSQIAAIGEGFTGRIICLEGDTEREFLEVLHLATRFFDFDNQYFVYGGKGAHQNLVYYIKDKNANGVRVDLAYDGDSNLSDQMPKLKQSVAIKSVFRFDRDFEAAFPPLLLAPALTAYLREYKDKSSNCSAEEVSEMLLDHRPFVKVVEDRFTVNISKVTLGRFLALEVLRLSEKDDRVMHGAGVLSQTEISKFLRWVMGRSQDVSPEENDDDQDIVFETEPPETQLPSSTAIHEAGHGLLFDALGLAVKRISIKTLVALGSNLDGHILLEEVAPDLLGIAGGLAGAAASIYIEGIPPNSVADEAFHSDDEYLRQKCQQLSSPTSFDLNWDMMHRFLHGWIRDWVRANKEAILRLACALDTAKCLESVALLKALNESWGEIRPDASQLEREIAAHLKFS